MKGPMFKKDPTPKSYRDLPEWQAAQNDYVSDVEGEDSEATLYRRIGAAMRMRDIERDWERSR